MLGTGTVIRAGKAADVRMHAFHDGQVNRASPHGYSASPPGSVAGPVLFRGPGPDMTTHCAGSDAITFPASYTLIDARNNAFAPTVVNLQCPWPKAPHTSVARAGRTVFCESTLTSPFRLYMRIRTV